jgi:hypothetical protein
LALWQAQCSGEVAGLAMATGNFIPEELLGLKFKLEN